ncbi:MAG: phytoene/squalene synthase family protein [Gammaproteobacteria bacterium]|nr:phytoene/squalene synthase family protein [Gammaproteobacteria bacterium]
MNQNPQAGSAAADEAYQERILQGVSRTFALTIPQLPPALCRVVSNAYLLCRIADTIEDDKHLPLEEKRQFADRFIRVVAGMETAAEFAATLAPKLSPTATADERDLIVHTDTVIRITHGFTPRQRAALEHCIRIMADGMARYQESNVRLGLKDLPDMDAYCYHVAGVVGEMLTELFCAHSPEIDRHRAELMPLAVSFGQGLQMTNILKDIWDDQRRGMCWLPRDIFSMHGADLRKLAPGARDPGFEQGLGHLIAVARSHLANALRYTLLIPARETGIRRFCLWALGMAVLTLRKINRNRSFASGNEVKISRRSVYATIAITKLLTRHDRLLRGLFSITARGLPETIPASPSGPLTGTV